MADSVDSHRLEHWVHRSLLAGLTVSGLLLMLGLIVALASGKPRPAGAVPSFKIIREVLGGDGVAMINLGLLFLMGTPILRVAVLAIGWTLRRSWRFAAVALAVLGLLGLSLVLGLSG